MPNRLRELWLEQRMRWISRGLRHFELAGEVGDTSVDMDAIYGELTRGPASTRFLDFYTRDGLEVALREYGVWEAVEERGIEPALEIRCDEVGRHLMRVVDRGRGEAVVVELCARFLSLHSRFGGVVPEDWRDLRVVAIDWLLMQHPGRAFAPERPPLPGQSHPGLGLGREVMLLLELMAERLGCDGLLAVPEHYHNGFLYDRRFNFVDPARQGELQALERDLSALSLAEASWAVELGQVRDTVSHRSYRWRPEEMLRPLTGRLQAWFEGEDYRRRRREIRERRRYTLSTRALTSIRTALASGRRPA